MKKILQTFINDPSAQNESAFEEALKTSDLFINPDFKMEIENETFIPVFTSVEDAQDFGIETQVTSLGAIPLGDTEILIINPNDEAVELTSLDVDTLLGEHLETLVLGEDNKSLVLMMQLKSTFDKYEAIEKAWLVRVQIGRHHLTYLVVEGIDAHDDAFQEILSLMEPYNHTHDVLLSQTKDAKQLIQGIKPFYTK